MSVIEPPARLINPLQALADKQRSSVEEIVEELVGEYLREQMTRSLDARRQELNAIPVMA